VAEEAGHRVGVVLAGVVGTVVVVGLHVGVVGLLLGVGVVG
jgi:hypothetical protein